jgi:recombinational DNA repair protein RecT
VTCCPECKNDHCLTFKEIPDSVLSFKWEGAQEKEYLPPMYEWNCPNCSHWWFAPQDKEADRGELRFVYAVAKLKDGGTQFDVMSKVEIDKIRARSKAGNFGPWKTDYDEMAKKTVIRRLFKYLPVSVEMQRAVGLDEHAALDVSQDNELAIGYEPAAQIGHDTSEATATEDGREVAEEVDEETGEVIPAHIR